MFMQSSAYRELGAVAVSTRGNSNFMLCRVPRLITTHTFEGVVKAYAGSMKLG
jgi:hypothetical protein